MNVTTINRLLQLFFRHIYSPALVLLVLWVAKTDPDYLYSWQGIVSALVLAVLRGVILSDLKEAEEDNGDY